MKLSTTVPYYNERDKFHFQIYTILRSFVAHHIFKFMELTHEN